MEKWRAARNEQQLKETLLHHERFLSLHLHGEKKTAELIEQRIRDLRLPPGCLIALVHRDGQSMAPGGNTMLRAGDRLTIIGDPDGIRQLYEQFREHA